MQITKGLLVLQYHDQHVIIMHVLVRMLLLHKYSLPQKIVRTPFFSVRLKTIELGVLDRKDIVDRALIYLPLYYYNTKLS